MGEEYIGELLKKDNNILMSEDGRRKISYEDGEFGERRLYLYVDDFCVMEFVADEDTFIKQQTNNSEVLIFINDFIEYGMSESSIADIYHRFHRDSLYMNCSDVVFYFKSSLIIFLCIDGTIDLWDDQNLYDGGIMGIKIGEERITTDWICDIAALSYDKIDQMTIPEIFAMADRWRIPCREVGLDMKHSPVHIISIYGVDFYFNKAVFLKIVDCDYLFSVNFLETQSCLKLDERQVKRLGAKACLVNKYLMIESIREDNSPVIKFVSTLPVKYPPSPY